MGKEKKYYICTNRHNCDGLWIFWGKEFCGYTNDLKRAGQYTKKELNERLSHFEEVDEYNKGDCLDFDDFIIEVGKVEILGKKTLSIVKGGRG